MANNRIFYACQAVALGPCFDGGLTEVHGVQSVGVNTTFNLEQAFELGQIQIYENIEGLPDVEVTLEKVLDGYPLMYHLSCQGTLVDGKTLVNRAKGRTCVALGIYPDDKDAVSGQAPVTVYMSGMYINSISYTFPVDGNATESITLVGNHKIWTASSGLFASGLANELSNFGQGTDEPKALTDALGGIQRREDFYLPSSILPSSIYGVVGTGAGNGWDNALGAPRVHIQNCSISTDLGREPILELGRKAPYYRAPNYPVEVTCEFEVISVSGDFIPAYEEGRPEWANTRNAGNNTPEEIIKVVTHDGTSIDLGNKCRLTSITYGGGDAGGGNVSQTYSYVTYNTMTVEHPEDPDT